MTLSKTKEAKIWKIYEIWLNAYLNDDSHTYDSFLDDDYHFIGSTNNEEFLNKKDTTKFFELTGKQFAGLMDLRNETKSVEQFDGLIFITHFCDVWFLNEEQWSYYGRFRLSSIMKYTDAGWRFLYQHFSMPDSKSDDGQTIGFENVKLENIQLKEAIKRRTQELELKNRELEIEGALERIRAQAVAMKASSDLLDIVVTMRNEFINLGHEAHYFWHMMWLPETYEKAMTSGDGSKIGFVMTLPRHIHGDIPLLAKWEKSKKPTVVYTFNTEESIDYVDKMIALGDFKNIDPQAPSHDDLRHIGGLTFVMARTTHGEVGYSLPGIVKNPPKEDLEILVRFAGVFDLAHKRFLDLQKAEAQAREVEIELALEKVRSRTMAMQKSGELSEASFLLDAQVRDLGIETWGCAFNIYGEEESKEWFGNEKGELNTYTVPRIGVFKDYYDRGQNGESLHIREFKGDECVEHYEFMSTLPGIGDVLKQLKKTNKGFPTFQIDHVVYFKYGYLLFITREDVPEAHEIFKRFAKVFEQTYTRFLDLQKAELQAREAQIEAALERVRARSMAMHSSSELQDVIRVIFDQMSGIDINAEHAGIVVDYEPQKDFNFWVAEHQELPAKISVPYLDLIWDQQFATAMKNGENLFTTQLSFEEKNDFYATLLPHIEGITPDMQKRYFERKGLAISTAVQKDIGLYIENFEGTPYTSEENDILLRFARVFQQTYTRFLDLQKAEAQAREAEIEASLERVRTASMAMHKTQDLSNVVMEYFKQLKLLQVEFIQSWITIFHLDKGCVDVWFSPLEGLYNTPTHFNMPSALFEETSIKSWKEGNSFSSISFETKEQVNHFFQVCDEVTASTYFGDIQKKLKLERFEMLDANHKYGCISKSNSVKATDEEKDILQRFAYVFEQTYMRFLDLQKAEAQAREAQIETALEKVRSRTMAMQASSELPVAANTLFLEVQALGIPAWSAGYCIWNADKSLANCNMSSEGEIQKGFMLPTIGEGYDFETPLKKGEKFHVASLGGKELVKHYEFMKTLPGVGEILSELVNSGLELPTFQIFHICYFKHGYVMFITYEPVPNAHDIFKRFTGVFEQTYTRFLDLEKAEAQAREAQIEVALERVRSQSMSMQRSEELSATTQVFHQQLQMLGIDSEFSYLWLPEEDEQHQVFWATWSENHKNDNDYHTKKVRYPLDKSEDSIAACYVAWESDDPVHVNEVKPEDVEDYFNTWSELLSGVDKFQPQLFQDGLYYIDAYMNYGCFGIMIKRLLNDSEKNILHRFSNEFQRTYTRFLDLQKAEAQAREAQIEAALERVRSQSMGMQSTADFAEVTTEMFTQLRNFGEDLFATGIVFCDKYEGHVEQWHSIPGGGMLSPMIVPIDLDYIHQYRYDQWKAGKELFSIEIPSDFIQQHFEDIFKLPSAQITLEDLESRNAPMPEPPPWEIDYGASFEHGYVLISSLKPLENTDILIRFTKVFEQAYTRYLDLKKAEAQAREAQIEAALEKVRSRSLSMQQPNELNEVVQLIAEKLQELDVILDLGGVVICTYFPDSKDVLHWIATPDSESSGKFHLPYFDHIILKEAWASKNKGDQWFSKAYSIEEKNSFFEHAFAHSDYKHFPIEAKKDILNRKHHTLSFAWSKHSALLIPSYSGLMPSDNEKNILIRFAKVFEHAYIRFMDLQEKEVQAKALFQEKKRLEETLSDLQTTQKQLIQSEKMASLGELTAGIAHEIQNPLNFVNNFSDVSKELLEEMLEEIENGDLEEAKAIMEDIVQNLDKINHHGKRADSIVKGMLQHSRASGDQKENTDINALANEYLRLAYHGLRAKDQSFNADLITDFDNSIEAVNIIPQDVGRVILNLLTNAFYVVNEKKKMAIEEYKPTVSISTKKKSKVIEIIVTDNGNGMPDIVKEKIFQPFFTTKPTGEGTGLGLSLSYDIITKGHGGDLKVVSKEGEGTTFTIEIPHK